ncbi:MAG: hypothetical protein EXR92_03750 [Gemmatimonadetes bacterium]|nr:hypothetical protein [Gemmatimonadota bacterium]
MLLSRILIGALAASLLLPWFARAQRFPSGPAPAEFEAFAGGEIERYLRTLQDAGQLAPYPWSIRALSPREIEALAVHEAAHPWSKRYSFAGDSTGGVTRRVQYGLLSPSVDVVYNSAFPFGGNDGPLWAGRGVTSAVGFGGYARWGPIDLTIAPVAFRAENQAFGLAPGSSVPGNEYQNAVAPAHIDLPQRFGDGAYQRLDAGNSGVRAELWGATVGLSSASQQWGPMDTHPLVLGANAGGFLHFFLGTRRPIGVGFGDVHVRYVAGRLERSEYSPTRPGDPRRLTTGLLFVILPRGLPGLELGGSRFIHRAWPADGVGWKLLSRPFENLLKGHVPEADVREPDNQLASLFVRWNLPESGFELYAEFLRDDYPYNVRVLVEEPDDLSGHAMGFRKVWQSVTGDRRSFTVLRTEVLNAISSHRERGGARTAYAFNALTMYQHGTIVEGHTHRGQLLASPAGLGGAAAILAVDRYSETGRWSVQLERRVERDRTTGVVPEDPTDVDVVYALGMEGLRFLGRLDARLGLTAVYNLNRYLSDDSFNLNLRVGASATVP